MHGRVPFLYFFSSRRRHTRYWRDWSSDVCSSDLTVAPPSTSASPNGIELANAGAGGVWPATPRITSSAPPLESFLDPKLGNTTAGNSPPTSGGAPPSNEDRKSVV